MPETAKGGLAPAFVATRSFLSIKRGAVRDQENADAPPINLEKEHLMRIRKSAMVVGAVLIPLATITLVAGPAFAAKVTGTGSVTCNVGGTASFNPPLSQNGAAASKEVVTLSGVTISNCSGGTPSASGGGTITIKPLKIKGTGKPKMAGSCSNLAGSVSTILAKTKTSWANGAKPTKTVESNFKIAVGSGASAGEEGFASQDGTASGSYAGSGSVTAYFTQSSSSAFIAACGGSGSLSTAQIDSSTSTFTF